MDRLPHHAPWWSILDFGEVDTKKSLSSEKVMCDKMGIMSWIDLFIKVRFIDVLKALTNISLTSSKTYKKNISLSLKKNIRISRIGFPSMFMRKKF